MQLAFNARSEVTAAYHRDHAPLFHFRGNDPIDALHAWAAAHAAALGLAPVDGRRAPTRLTLERTIDPAAGMKVHRYAQTYRGYRIVGSGETVAVTSLESGAVLSVVGALIDDRVDLAGVDAPLSRAVARAIVEAETGGIAPDELELVALPERETLAWLAELGGEHSRRLILSAVDGTIIVDRDRSAADAFDHAPLAAVRTYEMSDNPATTALAAYPSQGSTWDGSFNPYYGFLVRMGDDRLQIYDMERDNDALPTIYFAQQYFITGTPYLWYGLNSRFLATPNSECLSVPDAEPVPQGTDGPRAPRQRAVHLRLGATTAACRWASSIPAPLNLLTNVDSSPEAGETDRCDGALAVYNVCEINGNELQTPYPGDWTSCVYLCSNGVGTLLHELGHHVDNHATYGIMGSSVVSDSCLPDTTDEALSLRETIGDMTALYLARKLYPGLAYNFSTANPRCSFASFGQGSFPPHDPSCLRRGDSIGSFEDDRPGYSATSSCNPSAGYRMHSVNQAVWAWLFQRYCDETYPFQCVVPFGTFDVDAFMRGMIYALGLSNAQSYETFFENVRDLSLGDGGARRGRQLPLHDGQVRHPRALIRFKGARRMDRPSSSPASAQAWRAAMVARRRRVGVARGGAAERRAPRRCDGARPAWRCECPRMDRGRRSAQPRRCRRLRWTRRRCLRAIEERRWR